MSNRLGRFTDEVCAGPTTDTTDTALGRCAARRILTSTNGTPTGSAGGARPPVLKTAPRTAAPTDGPDYGGMHDTLNLLRAAHAPTTTVLRRGGSHALVRVTPTSAARPTTAASTAADLTERRAARALPTKREEAPHPPLTRRYVRRLDPLPDLDDRTEPDQGMPARSALSSASRTSLSACGISARRDKSRSSTPVTLRPPTSCPRC